MNSEVFASDMSLQGWVRCIVRCPVERRLREHGQLYRRNGAGWGNLHRPTRAPVALNRFGVAIKWNESLRFGSGVCQRRGQMVTHSFPECAAVAERRASGSGRRIPMRALPLPVGRQEAARASRLLPLTVTLSLHLGGF